MKPILKRGWYVRVESARYEWEWYNGERRAVMTHPAGQVGVVYDISSHPWSGGRRGVEGVFIAHVRLRDGTTTQVNERALTRVYGP